MEQEERKRAVWDALWKLDAEDRELLVARDILETPYATLAELLDVPIGTVMSRLYHARRRLREQLGEEWR
jgi:RNA polymerase sigma-70 factor (ECF subfamily)